MNPVHRFFEHNSCPGLARIYIVKCRLTPFGAALNVGKITQIIGLGSSGGHMALSVMVGRSFIVKFYRSFADKRKNREKIPIISDGNVLFCPGTPRAREGKIVSKAYVTISVGGTLVLRASLLLSLPGLSACSQPPIAVSDQRYGASDSAGGGDAKKEGECLSLADAVIGYDVTIKKIIEKQCLGGCHDAGLQTPPLSNYAEAKAAANVSLDSINAGRMPRRRSMPAEEKTLFANWVAAGMPQSDASATTAANNGNDSTVTGSVSGNSSPDIVVAPSKAPKKTASKCAKSAALPAPKSSSAAQPGVAATPPVGAAALVTYTSNIEPYLRAKCFSCHGPSSTPPQISDYETAKASASASLATILDKTMPKGGSNSPTEVKNFEAWVQGGMVK